MRNLKKFLALVLAMMMAVSLMVTANAQNANRVYPDMDKVTTEFVTSVEVLTGMGVFRGNNGDFLPQNNIMRSEAVAILYRLVTGDVEDKQVELYTPLATYFSDVTENDWFAPYVGFAVDAGYIKGYNGKFNPYANVTGYEMLAMLLRATGYGKNGEFTGAQWQINVGASAKSLGVLKDIESTHYKNTLSMASAREVVANLTFNVARQVNIVTWTPAAGYNKYTGLATSGNPYYLNPTLGVKVFGLTSYKSIIVGNQATGEDYTLLGQSYSEEGEPETAVKDKYGYPIKFIDVPKDPEDEDAGSTIVYIYRFGNDNSDETVNELYDEPKLFAKKADGSDAKAELEETDTEADYVQCDVNVYTGGSGTKGTSYSKFDIGGAASFDWETDLDQFAHEVTLWYNSGNVNSDGAYETYAMIDHVESIEHKFAEDNTSLGEHDKDGKTLPGVTGKKSTATVYWSDRFSQITSISVGREATKLSPISTYRIVHNPSGDVWISLSAEVGRVIQKNTTTSTGGGWLILGNGDDNKSTFTNDNDNDDNNLTGRIYLNQLTSDTKEDQKKVNALVTAYEVVGTWATLAKAEALNPAAKHDNEHPADGENKDNHIDYVQYKLAPMESKTVTVKSLVYSTSDDLKTIDGLDDPVIQVNTTAGDKLEISGITLGTVADGDATSEIIGQALPIVIKKATDEGGGARNIQVKAGTSYIAYTDLVGRFISLVPTDNYKFIYGTYADYVIGGLGTGTIAYNLVGVDWDAKIQGENTLKSATVGGLKDGEIQIDLDNLDDPTKTSYITGINDIDGKVFDMDGMVYSLIGTTKKDQGFTTGVAGNEIQKGAHTGYMYNATTGDLADWEGWQMADEDIWEFSAKDARNGFAQVKVGDTEWLLTSKTHFIIVDGTGTATLKVREATGLAELMGNATNGRIVFNKKETDGTQNEVIFLADDTKYGTAVTVKNGVIETVILSEDNLNLWNLQNLYFDYNQLDNGTGTVLPGTDPDEVQQFMLWLGAEEIPVFIDITKGDAVPADAEEPADGEPIDTTLGLYDDEAALKAAQDGHTLNQKPLFFTLAKVDEKNGEPIYAAYLATTVKGEDPGVGGVDGSGFNAQFGTYEYVSVSNVHTGLFKVNKGEEPRPQVVLNMDNVTVVDVQFQTTKDAKKTLGRNEITNVEQLNHAVSVGEVDNEKVYEVQVAVVYNTDNNSATTVYVLDTQAPVD